ncbi:hypothetical protein GQ53DRAFT_33355 [Thozetella sp. PMI_491]|nr:hypothetical protein GQ53DRAFT_33355 [Thozetella sp. PMI_491]
MGIWGALLVRIASHFVIWLPSAPPRLSPFFFTGRLSARLRRRRRPPGRRFFSFPFLVPQPSSSRHRRRSCPPGQSHLARSDRLTDLVPLSPSSRPGQSNLGPLPTTTFSSPAPHASTCYDTRQRLGPTARPFRSFVRKEKETPQLFCAVLPGDAPKTP